ncbi:MAG TPA: acyl-CoA dehydrogenase family protein [Deinococcales bacterium]|nr:acyl-CoA dehydrogenase family protein [Deinococcales bacterium]
MNFELPPELRQLRQAVREYARAELAPGAAERDAAGRFPRAELEGLAGLGLLGITTPTGHGGSGMGLLTSVTALEEIAAADASVATLTAVTNGFPQGSLVHWGSEWQRSDWLPRLASGDWIGAFCLSEPHCGSDAAAIRTRARKTRDGWVLNGEKAWITAGRDADFYLVLASTEPEAGARGISCFGVPAGTDGLMPGKAEQKLGQAAAVTSNVVFEDCFVPDSHLVGEPGEGFVIAMSQLDAGRINIAAQAVGIARAAFDAAVRWASEREAFGRQIREFQGTGFKLADMAVSLEAARLLTQRAAWLAEQGERVTREAAMAKLHASEAAGFITDAALQVFGGYGYSKEYPVERWWRDARVTRIYEGTSEIQRVVISRQLHRERGR